MANNNHVKDPSAVVDYAVDWQLYGDSALAPPLTIATSAFTISPVEAGGLLADAQTFEGKKAAVRLSGGIVGQIYQITNRITLSNGMTDERSFVVRVENT